MGEKKTEIIHFDTPCGKELFFPVATVTGNNPGPAAGNKARGQGGGDKGKV